MTDAQAVAEISSKSAAELADKYVVLWNERRRDEEDAATIDSSSADGPPPGVPANGITCLYDYESGKSIAIVFFETEEDMKTGEAAMNAMSNDRPEAGTRTSVSFYEAPVDIRA